MSFMRTSAAGDREHQWVKQESPKEYRFMAEDQLEFNLFHRRSLLHLQRVWKNVKELVQKQSPRAAPRVSLNPEDYFSAVAENWINTHAKLLQATGLSVEDSRLEVLCFIGVLFAIVHYKGDYEEAFQELKEILKDEECEDFKIDREWYFDTLNRIAYRKRSTETFADDNLVLRDALEPSQQICTTPGLCLAHREGSVTLGSHENMAKQADVGIGKDTFPSQLAQVEVLSDSVIHTMLGIAYVPRSTPNLEQHGSLAGLNHLNSMPRGLFKGTPMKGTWVCSQAEPCEKNLGQALEGITYLWRCDPRAKWSPFIIDNACHESSLQSAESNSTFTHKEEIDDDVISIGDSDGDEDNANGQPQGNRHPEKSHEIAEDNFQVSTNPAYGGCLYSANRLYDTCDAPEGASPRLVTLLVYSDAHAIEEFSKTRLRSYMELGNTRGRQQPLVNVLCLRSMTALRDFESTKILFYPRKNGQVNTETKSVEVELNTKVIPLTCLCGSSDWHVLRRFMITGVMCQKLAERDLELQRLLVESAVNPLEDMGVLADEFMQDWAFSLSRDTMKAQYTALNNLQMFSTVAKQTWCKDLFRAGLLSSRSHPTVAVSSIFVGSFDLPTLGTVVNCPCEVQVLRSAEHAKRICEKYGNYFSVELDSEAWWEAVPRASRAQILALAAVFDHDHVILVMETQDTTIGYACIVQIPEKVRSRFLATCKKFDRYVSWAHDGLYNSTSGSCQIPRNLFTAKQSSILSSNVIFWRGLMRSVIQKGPHEPVGSFSTMADEIYGKIHEQQKPSLWELTETTTRPLDLIGEIPGPSKPFPVPRAFEQNIADLFVHTGPNATLESLFYILENSFQFHRVGKFMTSQNLSSEPAAFSESNVDDKVVDEASTFFSHRGSDFEAFFEQTWRGIFVQAAMRIIKNCKKMSQNLVSVETSTFDLQTQNLQRRSMETDNSELSTKINANSSNSRIPVPKPVDLKQSSISENSYESCQLGMSHQAGEAESVKLCIPAPTESNDEVDLPSASIPIERPSSAGNQVQRVVESNETLTEKSQTERLPKNSADEKGSLHLKKQTLRPVKLEPRAPLQDGGSNPAGTSPSPSIVVKSANSMSMEIPFHTKTSVGSKTGDRELIVRSSKAREDDQFVLVQGQHSPEETRSRFNLPNMRVQRLNKDSDHLALLCKSDLGLAEPVKCTICDRSCTTACKICSVPLHDSAECFSYFHSAHVISHQPCKNTAKSNNLPTTVLCKDPAQTNSKDEELSLVKPLCKRSSEPPSSLLNNSTGVQVSPIARIAKSSSGGQHGSNTNNDVNKKIDYESCQGGIKPKDTKAQSNTLAKSVRFELCKLSDDESDIECDLKELGIAGSNEGEQVSVLDDPPVAVPAARHDAEKLKVTYTSSGHQSISSQTSLAVISDSRQKSQSNAQQQSSKQNTGVENLKIGSISGSIDVAVKHTKHVPSIEGCASFSYECGEAFHGSTLSHTDATVRHGNTSADVKEKSSSTGASNYTKVSGNNENTSADIKEKSSSTGANNHTEVSGDNENTSADIKEKSSSTGANNHTEVSGDNENASADIKKKSSSTGANNHTEVSGDNENASADIKKKSSSTGANNHTEVLGHHENISVDGKKTLVNSLSQNLRKYPKVVQDVESAEDRERRDKTVRQVEKKIKRRLKKKPLDITGALLESYLMLKKTSDRQDRLPNCLRFFNHKVGRGLRTFTDNCHSAAAIGAARNNSTLSQECLLCGRQTKVWCKGCRVPLHTSNKETGERSCFEIFHMDKKLESRTAMTRKLDRVPSSSSSSCKLSPKPPVSSSNVLSVSASSSSFPTYEKRGEKRSPKSSSDTSDPRKRPKVSDHKPIS